MDWGELVWTWLNGLVRRVTTGILFFFLFSVISLLLVISTGQRERDLRHLEGYSQLHAHYTDAFLEVAGLGTNLRSSKTSAMQPVEPLRRALKRAQELKTPELACARVWLNGFRDLQLVPENLANACPSEGETCQIPHAKILLGDLVAFERGIGAVQDALPAIDKYCFSKQPDRETCSYYLQHRDKDIYGLSSFVEKHYRQTLPQSERRLLGLKPKTLECAAESPFLADYVALVREIDPTARPRTLADFEKVGESISTRRVAIQSADTNVTSAPGGGILTLSVPRDVSLPIFQFLGLLSIAYAFLNIRRLDRLSRGTDLGSDREHYKLFTVASHTFTAPVFGSGLPANPAPTGMARTTAAILVVGLFNWIPSAACLVSIFVAALMWMSESGFSLVSAALVAGITLLQTVTNFALFKEQRAVKAQFQVWTADSQVP
jgi:hypothetical protein